MHNAKKTLDSRLRAAVVAAFGAEHADIDPQLRNATRSEFGHLQTNLPLRLAKPLRMSPQKIGAALLEVLDVSGMCLPPTLAGQGFVNFTWTPEFLAAQVTALLGDKTTGAAPSTAPQRVVLDYSSPNIAKQMHVGHLRSTVIGDALGRILSFTGSEVVRQNHLGDWGTQFGMLIEELLHQDNTPAGMDLDSLNALYQSARARFEGDSSFADQARLRVVALQSRDEATLHLWQQLVDVSLAAFQEMYTRMGSDLTPEDVAGESFYNELLPSVVSDLQELGLLQESEGAQCVFLPGFQTREGDPLPVIVQKADGGYGYDATDLAALRYRVEALQADRIVYVVDARQSLHFEQVFALARAASWLPENVTAEHVAFGTVLGADGKPFKTRSGGTVSLASLLDQAEAKALTLLEDRGSTLPGTHKRALARSIGIGAVKYADLSSDLGRDYVFSVDKMVALDGNTGPYLQYAHARLTSLLGRAGVVSSEVTELLHPAEEKLALLLTLFLEVMEETSLSLEPHKLCTYLYQVASALSGFYENCPVLTSTGETLTSRLALCQATRKILGTGLNLLGIDAPERM